jgi:hypothetical protein
MPTGCVALSCLRLTRERGGGACSGLAAASGVGDPVPFTAIAGPQLMALSADGLLVQVQVQVQGQICLGCWHS